MGESRDDLGTAFVTPSILKHHTLNNTFWILFFFSFSFSLTVWTVRLQILGLSDHMSKTVRMPQTFFFSGQFHTVTCLRFVTFYCFVVQEEIVLVCKVRSRSLPYLHSSLRNRRAEVEGRQFPFKKVIENFHIPLVGTLSHGYAWLEERLGSDLEVRPLYMENTSPLNYHQYST